MNIDHPRYGTLTVVSRRGQKNINLRIDNTGKVKLSSPKRTPKYAINNFIKKNEAWIDERLRNLAQAVQIKDGSKFGVLQVAIAQDCKKSSLVGDIVTIAASKDPKEELKKLLRKHSKNTYPDILRARTSELDLKLNEVRVRATSSRWGSCSSKKNINISIYVLALPEHIQQYILHHEIAHLKEMSHSVKFWSFLEQIYPEYRQAQKDLKDYRHILGSLN